MSKSKLTLAVAGVVSALSMGVTTQEAEAANWLMLQGTESPGAVGRAKVWGFIQPEVQYTDGEKVAAGPWEGSNFAPNMIAPNLTSRATFQMRRARIGVRGQGFPLDNKVNYFILSEFGNNGITNYSGAALTDASVTLNHVP
ncbi:MAG: porin, partial [Gammaproteobacteria bacterium]|nr:porin [Gammaproteobacteria bacterium]